MFLKEGKTGDYIRLSDVSLSVETIVSTDELVSTDKLTSDSVISSPALPWFYQHDHGTRADNDVASAIPYRKRARFSAGGATPCQSPFLVFV